MILPQKVSMYIQEEIIIALSWEINHKVTKVWVLSFHDLKGNVDLCEITNHKELGLKPFIRDVLKNGNYISKNPMCFDTYGFEKI